MIRILALIATVAVLALAPARQASAQNNTLGGAIIGGGVGAIIGGAATGDAGGAVAGGIIGAAAGAALGSQMEPRRRGYYWHNGRCWQRRGDGNYYRVSRNRC
ncbi:MAG: glycine zipper domain-containing protein [Pseudolabrys sp.]|nr:glycine zipper domain-containing protein [Pseudolabrys sp.]MDP2294300.1 glycine zipper domain-containing protein [Pseudolabrys sp.]